MAAGREWGPSERQLVERLTENWYHTAADLASMSKEEVGAMQMPYRLWVSMSKLLQTPTIADMKDDSTVAGVVTATAQGAQSSTDDENDGSIVEEEEQQQTVLELHPDIMQRRAPPGLRAEYGSRGIVKLRKDKGPKLLYGLKASETSEALAAELVNFEKFCTQRFFGQLVDPVSAATHMMTMSYLKLLLGWLHRYKGVPLEELSLRCAVPTSERQGISLVFEWLEFLRQDRGANCRSQYNALCAVVHVVRFLYHDDATGSLLAGHNAYAQLPVMTALKQLVNDAFKAVKKAPLVSDESKKWLEWSEFLGVVRRLRAECAGLDHQGNKRSPAAVAHSIQRYLIFAILSCIPDRQRTLRELRVGSTLVKEDDRWLIRHGPGDYKTGKLYGERPPMVIAPFIYPELEAFISTWRAELQPRHDCLFTTGSGTPFTANTMYMTFSRTAERLTGRPTNPHLVRDMVVTHLKTLGTSELQMEALALYMGHSVKMQRDTYDRRTRAQKVTPAVELLQSMFTDTVQA
eukprot:jgi/Chrzof1/7609/Cz02g30040.t1